jgi:hypothetical protein
MSNDEFASLIAEVAALGAPIDLLKRIAAGLDRAREDDVSADAARTLADKRERDRLRKQAARARSRSVSDVSADMAPVSPSPAPSPEKETPPPAPPLKKNKPLPDTPTLFGAGEVASDTPFALESEPAPTKSKRGTRLPADWVLPKAWGEWALAEFPFLTVGAVREIADDFRDYWAALPGAKACKLDWLATWRNSVRMKAGKYRGGTPGRRMTKVEETGQNLRQRIDDLQRRKQGGEGGGDLRTPVRLLAVSGKTE